IWPASDTGFASASELNSGAVSDTRRNFDCEGNSFADAALTRTLATWITDNITEPTAGWAGFGGHHATQNRFDRTGDLAGTTTGTTGFWVGTWFHGGTLTAITTNGSFDFDRLFGPKHRFFKINMSCDEGILAAAWTGGRTTASSPAEERFKDIREAAETTGAAEACSSAIFVTCGVIVASFFAVGQHFIGVGDSLKLFTSFFRRVVIRVQFAGLFAVGFFDFLLRGVPFNTQDLIVILCHLLVVFLSVQAHLCLKPCSGQSLLCSQCLAGQNP